MAGEILSMRALGPSAEVPLPAESTRKATASDSALALSHRGRQSPPRLVQDLEGKALEGDKGRSAARHGAAEMSGSGFDSPSMLVEDMELRALEGKLQLLTLQRKLSQAKCQTFMDDLESYSLHGDKETSSRTPPGSCRRDSLNRFADASVTRRTSLDSPPSSRRRRSSRRSSFLLDRSFSSPSSVIDRVPVCSSRSLSECQRCAACSHALHTLPLECGWPHFALLQEAEDQPRG